MRGKDGDETGGVRRRDRRRVVVSNQERGRKRRKAQLKKTKHLLVPLFRI